MINKTLLSFLLGLSLLSFACKSDLEQKQEVLEYPFQVVLFADTDLVNEYNSLSLTQKIGQLLIPRAVINASYFTKFDSDLLSILEKLQPGGILFFSKNIKTEIQIKNLISSIQNSQQIPLFIAVDMEGGSVNRFKDINDPLLANMRSALAMQSTFTPAELEFYAKSIAHRLYNLGFNMNLAPVADVRYKSTPSFLASRIFGSNAQEASSYVRAFVKGQQSEGIINVLKHFPGHGSANGDTHFAPAKVTTSRDLLFSQDFLPYRSLNDGGDLYAVMLGHLRVPYIDNNTLSSFSPYIVKILRKDIGFDGLILSDSLRMKSVVHSKNIEINSLSAGVDILLDPLDPFVSQKNIMNALEDGTLDESVLKYHVLNVLYHKRLLLGYQPSYGEKNVAKNIADKSEY